MREETIRQSRKPHIQTCSYLSPIGKKGRYEEPVERCRFLLQTTSISTIPDFDPSMLKPPSPSPADIIAQGEAAAKRAKLEQLCAHLDGLEELTVTA